MNSIMSTSELPMRCHASQSRRPIHFNPSASSWTAPSAVGHDLPLKFHKSLPNYCATPLTPLQALAKDIGVGSIHIKDESSRLGLPSFKILGASWGTFRAIAQKYDLPVDADLEQLRDAVEGKEAILYAATDGNHGRAVGRMGSLLGGGTHAEIHVPKGMSQETVELIESEGATVVKSQGNYEDAIAAAWERSKSHYGGILVQDTAFEGYEDIPSWIVEGYSTMLNEIDEQLGDTAVDLIITPVGVGSLAQSVVTHFKAPSKKTKVVTVEPDTAACLWNSVRRGKMMTTATTATIMAGLDCGEVSTIAWPLLRDGADASLTVSDYEAHVASKQLIESGVNAGPCGASGLAALKRLTQEDRAKLGLCESSVVVLLCTEGKRGFDAPLDVSVDDPVALTQMLVQIDSSSPDLGSLPGPGETVIARYIKAWLEHRNIESHWIEQTPGRPSVVGVVRGTGGGRSLMLNGHIDTVTCRGYADDPLSGQIVQGKLYGRGSADMKSGVAAQLSALVRAKGMKLRGDVIFTGVADEENISIGTEQILAAGWTADAAIVSEPTNLEIIHKHKGFVWIEVDVHGVAAHGSRADLGVDAICQAGHFLVELGRYAQKLKVKNTDPSSEPGSVHASLVKGGEETSSYPAKCTITLERRTVAGETPELVRREIEDILQEIAARVDDFKFDLRVTFSRPPFAIDREDPFFTLVTDHVHKALGGNEVIRGERFWTDCALLAEKGIRSLLWGPTGEGLHAKEEWVSVDSIHICAETLSGIVEDYCK